MSGSLSCRDSLGAFCTAFLEEHLCIKHVWQELRTAGEAGNTASRSLVAAVTVHHLCSVLLALSSEHWQFEISPEMSQSRVFFLSLLQRSSVGQSVSEHE